MINFPAKIAAQPTAVPPIKFVHPCPPTYYEDVMVKLSGKKNRK